MHPAIAQHRTGIAAFCQRYGIRRLEVFGSAARANDFDPAHSDADFLVEFASGVQPGLNAIFGAKADLEALLLIRHGLLQSPDAVQLEPVEGLRHLSPSKVYE